jgi:hypothetical protein
MTDHPVNEGKTGRQPITVLPHPPGAALKSVLIPGATLQRDPRAAARPTPVQGLQAVGAAALLSLVAELIAHL